MGIALAGIGDFPAAIDSYQKAVSINPNYSEAYQNIGVSHQEMGECEVAIINYKRALQIKPDDVEVYCNMGSAYQDKGDLKAAIDSFKKALNIKPDSAEAYRHLTDVNDHNEHDEYFFKMQRLYMDPSTSDNQRCHLSFALSKKSEDLDEIEQCFAYLKMGNELRKKILSYEIKQDLELFSQLKKSYPRIAEVDFQPATDISEVKPIFILGMPRSGTTLIEQIISSHSKVAGAGELNFVKRFGQFIARGMVKPNTNVIVDFRKSYIDELKKRSGDKSFVTDKMPWNFRYIGLIFATFPDAKVIHVNRDPAATCWSNYKHYFGTTSVGYCYNLDDIVTYFGLYQDLMQFWQGHYGDRIYNINYDNLTINQVSETRKLIQYLGLTWQNACLTPESNKRSIRTASNQQIRKKVYQGSSEEWRKFEPYIDGAFDPLTELN